MSVNTESIIHNIMERISEIGYVKPEDIPNIDLYMDQVTTFMEAQLAHSKRYKDDKILTKTMINNYAKNNLLPSPEKKRYSKEHLLVLIFIYYFKNILSINDIQTLLGPLTDKYFKSDENIDLTSIYTEVFSMEKGQIEALRKELLERYEIAQGTFEDAPEEDRDFLKLFSFICLLSFDVYVKKMLIEQMIDDLRATTDYDPKHKIKKISMQNLTVPAILQKITCITAGNFCLHIRIFQVVQNILSSRYCHWNPAICTISPVFSLPISFASSYAISLRRARYPLVTLTVLRITGLRSTR